MEACEHNVDETKAAIEDMAFQKSQCERQKENALKVLAGEAAYLTEHVGTVQRKASEVGGAAPGRGARPGGAAWPPPASLLKAASAIA